MIPEHIFFPGLEPIPHLEAVVDDDGAPIFLTVQGNCPIVICAPHAGSESTTPGKAKCFGERQDDPRTAGKPVKCGDNNTLKITFAIIRTLSAMGATPHGFINLVSRKYMDVNRRWRRQELWKDLRGTTYRPGDEGKSPQDFPRLDEFKKFKQDYWSCFHDAISATTTALHPDGWLFDVHGQSFGRGNLKLFSGYGHYARRDFVYDSADSLHHYLVEQGFRVRPERPDPADEDLRKSGKPATNTISGGLYGAHSFDPENDPIPHNGIVVPGPEPRRIHGIQFEIEQSLRINKPDEILEGVGVNLALAVYHCLHGNGLISRNQTFRAGKHACSCYATLG